ncbi:hypothetical protein RI845_13280 [Thalassotalea nanhaiensis]|uniref:Peptidase MA-like domain-containing protein n=1 Tax=Thalassotalea nanhaiensis TaxID=3065648 RepID=A0ABY9TFE3_9GAMM|nr:hypothetical protein RI845_13280 [Colwelliaceae bacterium SQ345]
MRRFSIVPLLLSCFFSSTLLAEERINQINYAAVGNVPNDTMKEIEETVDLHYRRIIKNFNVKDMPPVSIKIWQDRNEFEQSYGDDAKYVQGYVVQDLWEARFFNGRPELGLGVVHEYTHLVTLAVNPTFNNNPRWLWEATAIYESGRPPVPDISKLKCFSANSYPTIESLEQHPFNIYKVGYFLTDFIISKWGHDKLVELVKSNGNINLTLKVTVKDFEKMWLSFLQKKHKLNFSETSEKNC